MDGDSDDGENRSPKSQGEEEEIAEESRVKSDDQQHLEVGEIVKIVDDGGSSRSGSNSDDENRGGMTNKKAESSDDSTKVGDYESLKPIEATSNTPMDDSVVGEKTTLLIEQVEVHNEQSPSHISVTPPYVVQSAVKENGEKKFTKISSSSLERTIDQSDANPRSNNGAQHVKESPVIQVLSPSCLFSTASIAMPVSRCFDKS